MSLPSLKTFWDRLEYAYRRHPIYSRNIRYGKFTQKMAGGLVGVSQGAARKWQLGESLPTMSHAVEMARKLDVSVEWLLLNMVSTAFSGQNANIPDQALPVDAANVSMVDWENAGRDWSAMKKQIEEGKLPTISTSNKVSAQGFGMFIHSDAMTAAGDPRSIAEGSFVLFDPETPAVHGTTVLARIDSAEQLVLRQLVIEGGKRFLKARNPDYKTIEVTDDTEIIAVAVVSQINLL